MLGADHVLITDEHGKVEEILPLKEAGDDIQTLHGIITPGFINCHCHLELSHMKGLIPEKTGLVDFVFKIVNERHFPDEEIADAIVKGENEMLANGIVAVGDISNNLSTLRQKLKNRLAYYTFIEVSGWNPAIAELRFNRSAEFVGQFKIHPDFDGTKFKINLAPHAPYSVSENLWEMIAPDFSGQTVTMHNQETNFEDDLFINGTGDFTRMYSLMNIDTSFFKPTGKGSLQSVFGKMKAAKNVLLVHNTFTKEEDIAFVSRESSVVSQDVFYCLCVNANQYIENALPPVDLLRKHNSQIVIGTDSLASNWSLSILDELKMITKNFPHIPLTELLQWSTLNGAKALQMDDRLGSFEKGKTPGVILVEGWGEEVNSEKLKVKRLL
jgi:cytosine/adenosine deaminase-related metal-dependent hydrolase